MGKDFFENRAFLLGIPRTTFNKYWESRLQITENAYQEFRQLFVKEIQPTQVDFKKCPKCGHEWQPRVPNPVECPNCKNRLPTALLLS